MCRPGPRGQSPCSRPAGGRPQRAAPRARMAAEGKFFGASKFDPRLISTQIVVMQAAFWFCFAGVYSIANWIIGAPQSLSQMFVGKGYTWATTPGLALACSLWATTFAMVAALRIVVERAKKCLDFVATYHIFHLVATCFVSGFPSELHWWVIHAAALIVAVVVGEYVCMLGDIDDQGDQDGLEGVQGAGQKGAPAPAAGVALLTAAGVPLLDQRSRAGGWRRSRVCPGRPRCPRSRAAGEAQNGRRRLLLKWGW
ncbi:unnamed protein product [Prorocentrum cordatum]|nr:unnamed protein product [Polarella glacialis]